MRRSLLGLVALFVAVGCRAVEPEPTATRETFRPWTRDFLEPAVLVAREVRVEGPSDLLEHFASLQDPATVDVEARNLPEQGLLQVFEIKPGLGGVDIRAQLDGLEIRALSELAVLHRLERDAPVVVRATGDAWWALADGSEERRDDTIVLRGTHGP